ncbi:hypothetical protein PI125_g27133 [Phytophthora idaei]|nr:hypothetical protein PI125_g27133 [Phytophthora idaei]
MRVSAQRLCTRPGTDVPMLGASNNFVRQQSLPKLNFEDVDTPRSVLEVRLATGATVRTEKRVVRVR